MAWYNKILNPFSNNTEVKSIDDGFGYSPLLFTNEASTPAKFVNTYGEVGWVFACVSRISSAIAETKWRLYSQDNRNERTEILDHPILDLFDFVNEFHTGLEMMEQTQTFIDLLGEAFWLVLKDQAGQPAEIWVLNPNKIKVVPDKKMYIKGYVYKNGNDEIPLNIADVVHIKLPNPKNPFRGQSPLGSVNADIEAEKHSSSYNRTFFQNSAEPSGVIQFEGTLTDSQYERLRYQWNKQYQGSSNAHKVAILEGGASWQGNMVTHRDMQFRDLRIMNRDVIMGVYGMPKHILGIAEDVNRANAEASEYTFARWVLKPRLERIKAKLNEQFIPMYSQENLILDYDTPIPDDIARNLAVADQGFKAGYITRNEARHKIGLEPTEDGDMFMEPLSSVAHMMGQTQARTTKAQELDQKSEELRWKAFIEGQAPIENEFANTLGKYFDEQKNAVTKNIEAEVTDDNVFDENMWNEKLFEILKILIKKALLKGADNTKREIEDRVNNGQRMIKKDTDIRFAFDVDDESADIVSYIENQGLKKAKGINKITGNLITAELVDARNSGLGAKETADKVRSVSGFARGRAEKIARTETIGALNFGSLQSSKQSEIVKSKKWLAALDEVTRETHEEANGQIVGLDEEFIVGFDSMLTPCTGNLAEENVNCRCTITEVLDFDMADQIMEQESNLRLSVSEDVVTKSDDKYTYPLAEARCPQCNKLLGKKILGTANLYCNRCKAEIKFSNTKSATLQ
jgi:HK97 family phage portal protein